MPLPVPLSPVIRTVVKTSATLRVTSLTRSIDLLFPNRPSTRVVPQQLAGFHQLAGESRTAAGPVECKSHLLHVQRLADGVECTLFECVQYFWPNRLPAIRNHGKRHFAVVGRPQKGRVLRLFSRIEVQKNGIRRRRVECRNRLFNRRFLQQQIVIPEKRLQNLSESFVRINQEYVSWF